MHPYFTRYVAIPSHPKKCLCGWEESSGANRVGTHKYGMRSYRRYMFLSFLFSFHFLYQSVPLLVSSQFQSAGIEPCTSSPNNVCHLMTTNDVHFIKMRNSFILRRREEKRVKSKENNILIRHALEGEEKKEREPWEIKCITKMFTSVSCLLPIHHVTMAAGREPVAIHSIWCRWFATSRSLCVIRADRGLTTVQEEEKNGLKTEKDKWVNPVVGRSRY